MENATLNKYQKPVLLFMKHLAMWAPQGSIIIDVTAGTGTTGVCSLMCSCLVKFCTSQYLIYFNFVLQVAVSFLGRANYLRDKALDSVDAYQPYFVILIDKEESQIKGYEIRLKSCLNEVPRGEVFVLKGGIFCKYDSPSYYGFPKSNCLIATIVFFHEHCHN